MAEELEFTIRTIYFPRKGRAGKRKTSLISGFPDVNTTGVQSGIILTPQSGDWTISTPGVYENKHNTGGSVIINANNVTLRNCRCEVNSSASGSSTVIYVNPGKTGVIIEYCEVTANGVEGVKGIWPDGANGTEIRYCDVSGCEDCVFSFANNLYIHDNYFHDQANVGADPHMDSVQLVGIGNIVEHNTMVATFNQNSIFAIGDNVASNDITVNNNLMRSGPNMLCPFNIGDTANAFTCVYRVTNNVIEEGHVGAGNKYLTWNGIHPATIWTGNTDYVTGATIPNPTA